MLNLPNKITVARMILTPAFIACLLYWEPGTLYYRILALGIFVTACVTDACDGYLARSRGQITRLGSLIDPLADKLLLISAYLALTVIRHLPAEMRLPPWITVMVVSRDIFILLGSVMIFVMNHRIEAFTNFLGKATTAVQMFLIIAVLSGFPSSAISALIGTTAILVVLSGASYLKKASDLLSGGEQDVR